MTPHPYITAALAAQHMAALDSFAASQGVSANTQLPPFIPPALPPPATQQIPPLVKAMSDSSALSPSSSSTSSKNILASTLELSSSANLSTTKPKPKKSGFTIDSLMSTNMTKEENNEDDIEIEDTFAGGVHRKHNRNVDDKDCLLYTSDAADE